MEMEKNVAFLLIITGAYRADKEDPINKSGCFDPNHTIVEVFHEPVYPTHPPFETVFGSQPIHTSIFRLEYETPKIRLRAPVTLNGDASDFFRVTGLTQISGMQRRSPMRKFHTKKAEQIAHQFVYGM